jgi:hypothetical protein
MNGAFGAGPAIAGAESQGLDLFAEHRTSGPVTAWVAWSMLDAQSTLTHGHPVRSSFDVTHTASASVSAAISSWSLG